MTATLQREHHIAFLLWGHSAENGVRFEHGCECLDVFWQVAGVESCASNRVAICGQNAGFAGHRCHCGWVVARDDLDSDALLGKELDGLGCVAAHAFFEGHQGDGLERSRQGFCLAGEFLSNREHQDSASGTRQFDGPPKGILVVFASAIERELRRTENPGLVALAGGKGERAPLACRRKARGCDGIELAVCGVANGEALGGGVGVLVCAEMRQNRLGEVVAREFEGLVELDVTLGKRSGLVEADRVNAGQALDGRKFLHEHLPARELHRCDGEGQAG